jgi:hypothetical protein
MTSTPLTYRISRGIGLLGWCVFAIALSWWLSRSIMVWDEIGKGPLLACLAVGLTVWIALQPVVGLYLLVLVNFLLPRLVDSGWLPLSLFWLNDLVMASWLIHVAVRSVTRRELPRTPFDFLALMLLTVFVMSCVANSLPPLQIVIGSRYYFKYLAGFYLILAIGFSPATLRRLYVVLCLLALLQVPLCMLQYAETRSPADWLTGTLNTKASGLMTFWQLTAAALVIGAYFAGLVSARVASLAGLAVIPPFLGTVQAIFVFFPLVMGGLAVPHLLARNWQLVRRYLGLTVLVPAVIGGVAMLASPDDRQKVIHDSTVYIRSPEEAVAYSDLPGGGRLASFKDAWRASDRGTLNRLLGLGPGVAGESTFRVGTTGGATLVDQRNLHIAVTMVDYLLVDLGVVGLLIVLAMLPLAYWVNLRAYRRARTPHERVVTYALFGIIPLYAVFFLYLPCWITDVPSFLFWSGIAYVTPIAQRRRLWTEARRPSTVPGASRSALRGTVVGV